MADKPGLDPKKVTSDYSSRLSLYTSLKEEVEYVLKSRLNDSEIKVHDIESRVKTLTLPLSLRLRRSE
jgi:hypothetical protein